MKNKGFTLIELLVVIAIIGLLSTLAVVALGNARVKARDSKRMSDLKQIQTALELYYTDYNTYPLAATAITLGNQAAATQCLNGTGFVTTANCGDRPYMGSVPDDPQNSTGMHYSYTGNTSTYSVDAALEDRVNNLSGNIRLTPSGIATRP